MKITSFSRDSIKHSGSPIEREINMALSHLELLNNTLISIKNMLEQSGVTQNKHTNNTIIE